MELAGGVKFRNLNQDTSKGWKKSEKTCQRQDPKYKEPNKLKSESKAEFTNHSAKAENANSKIQTAKKVQEDWYQRVSLCIFF